MHLAFFKSVNEFGGPIDENAKLPAEGFEILMPSVGVVNVAYEQVTYRKCFVKNISDKTVNNVVVYIKEQTPALGDDIFIAAGTDDDTVEEAKNYEYTAPYEPSTGIKLADSLQPGEARAFWIKRVVYKGAEAYPLNHYTIEVQYTYLP